MKINISTYPDHQTVSMKYCCSWLQNMWEKEYLYVTPQNILGFYITQPGEELGIPVLSVDMRFCSFCGERVMPEVHRYDAQNRQVKNA